MRGSCPSSLPTTRRYGGNTSSVSIEVPGQPPLLLDLGTGVVPIGRSAAMQDGFRGTALVTHLHFDHVLGLPFFAPVNRPGGCLDIVGPPQPEGSLDQAFAALVRPPYFPLHLRDLQGHINFFEVSDDRFEVGAMQVTSRFVPHLGQTLGYRIESEGKIVSYLSDHQAPVSLQGVDDAVLELCEGADLLIHDAQYTREEFFSKPDWGHSTPEYALLVAGEGGARRLCLFHHDPCRADDDIDRMLDAVRPGAAAVGVAVLAAAENMVLDL